MLVSQSPIANLASLCFWYLGRVAPAPTRQVPRSSGTGAQWEQHKHDGPDAAPRWWHPCHVTPLQVVHAPIQLAPWHEPGSPFFPSICHRLSNSLPRISRAASLLSKIQPPLPIFNAVCYSCPIIPLLGHFLPTSVCHQKLVSPPTTEAKRRLFIFSSHPAPLDDTALINSAICTRPQLVDLTSVPN